MRVEITKIMPEQLGQTLQENPMQPLYPLRRANRGKSNVSPPPGERNQVFVYSLCGNHSPTSSGGREDIPKVPRFQRVGIWP